jgi:tetraacyldisaccharide 4'-kinase
LFVLARSAIIHWFSVFSCEYQRCFDFMFRPSHFRDLVSGRQQSVSSVCARGLLRVAEVPYTLAMTIRNRRFDSGAAQIHRVDVPVISVGNITLGGTGKSPLVKWLANKLQASGIRLAIVSRGYGAANNRQNDEALELADALPQVPHIQNRDRVAAAHRAIREFGAEILLLDDGFQHRRLGRDADIVLLDALEPFGFDHVFPRGTLREPLDGLRRANVVCLSRADAISQSERKSIQERVAKIAPNAAWCEASHAARQLLNTYGETQALESYNKIRVAAFCGIGNPVGFRHTLAHVGCQPIAWREFPDHHAYTPADLSELIVMIRESKADSVLCTQKDLVKIRQQKLGGIPLWALAIEIKFLSGQNLIEQLLERVLQQNSPKMRNRR